MTDMNNLMQQLGIENKNAVLVERVDKLFKKIDGKVDYFERNQEKRERHFMDIFVKLIPNL